MEERRPEEAALFTKPSCDVFSRIKRTSGSKVE